MDSSKTAGKQRWPLYLIGTILCTMLAGIGNLAELAWAAVRLELPDQLEAYGEIVVDVGRVTDFTLAIQPELSLRARAGKKTIEFNGAWGEEAAGWGPYSISAGLGESQIEVWGGGHRGKRWADDQNLVALVGVEHGGPRLRVLHGQWGLDHTDQRTGVRWQSERQGAAGVRSKNGILLLAGLPPPELEEADEWDESLDDGQPNEQMDDPPGVGLHRGLDRGVIFGSYQDKLWCLKGSLAAALADGAQGFSTARAVLARFSPPGWRLEFRHSEKAEGYTKPDAVGKGISQMSIARANGRLGTRLVWKQEREDVKAPIDSWALSVSAKPGISAAGVGAVYTLHQVRQAKGNAWRMHAQCHTGSGGEEHFGYPWVWDAAPVQRWQASLEGRWAVGTSGGVGIRLSIAESKNGRLSWSYPLFSGGRALSGQSHSGLRLETLLTGGAAPGWRFVSETVIAEEVKHEPKPGELPRATYWAWCPSFERDVAEHVKLTVLSGMLVAQEYSGARVEEVVQMLQLKFIL